MLSGQPACKPRISYAFDGAKFYIWQILSVEWKDDLLCKSAKRLFLLSDSRGSLIIIANCVSPLFWHVSWTDGVIKLHFIVMHFYFYLQRCVIFFISYE